MNFFKRNKIKNDRGALVVPAPVTSRTQSYSFFNNHNPLTKTEFDFYKNLRESVPIIDAAIDKTVRLIGDFQVVTDDKSAQKALDNFLKNVPTVGGNCGIYSFITNYINEMLTYGQAVGEIVLRNNNSDVAALYNADFNDVEITTDSNPLNIIVCTKEDNTPAPYQNLILTTLLNPESGSVRGTSILRGLPFVSSVLKKIFETIGTNWDRVGNIRYAVTYKPETANGNLTSQQAQQIADEWSKAMRSTEVCDFVSVGDVNIRVIGADNQILDCDVPIKHLLEQIVAKLGLPPFVLGLSWSSTERMSSQQADILTSELEYYRSLITPVIRKICSVYLRLNGYDDGITVNWNLINLQDELELSEARLNNAQALEIEERIKREYGLEGENENGTGY